MSRAGATGRAPVVWSSTLADARTTTAPAFMCGAMLFDSNGRINTVCVNLSETNIVLIDPVSLDVLAFRKLPKVSSAEGGLATAYMILDNIDRAWVPSGEHLLVIEQVAAPGGTTFNIAHDYDLSEAVQGNLITPAMPDFDGRMWFVTRTNGIVGVLNPATGSVQSMTLGEEIANGFAVDHADAYIVSTKKMYRFTEVKTTCPAWCGRRYTTTSGTPRMGSTRPARARPRPSSVTVSTWQLATTLSSYMSWCTVPLNGCAPTRSA